MICSKQIFRHFLTVVALFTLVLTCSKEKSSPKEFRLTEGMLKIKQANYESTLYKDEYGYPHIDWHKYDRNNYRIVDKEYRSIVLENRYIKLTLLPEMGRVYSFYFKPTGHEEFWQADVAKPLAALNDTGWWLVIGGAEYVLPRGEHGTTWSTPWEYEIVRDDDSEKSVRMTVQELKTKLIEHLQISIFPDRSYYRATITIENPNDHEVLYSHWINPMWSPGGQEQLTPNTEFILAADSVVVADKPFNVWMGSPKVQSFKNNPLRFAKNWKNMGDLLVKELSDGFYSAYSHDQEEGIVRVFDKDVTPGVDIWTWGYPPSEQSQKAFAHAPNMGYVEMWGGVTMGYSDEDRVSLRAKGQIQWSEYMYPYHKTGGLTFANQDVAINLVAKSQLVEIGICPTGYFKDTEITLTHEDVTHWNAVRTLDPYRIVRQSIEIPDLTRGSEVQLRLMYQGREIAVVKTRVE